MYPNPNISGPLQPPRTNKPGGLSTSNSNLLFKSQSLSRARMESLEQMQQQSGKEGWGAGGGAGAGGGGPRAGARGRQASASREWGAEEGSVRLGAQFEIYPAE